MTLAQHTDPARPPHPVWWALNRAAQVGNPSAGRNKWRLPAPFKYNDFVVYPATPRLPYGRSTHARSYLTHASRAVLLAWHRGALVGHVMAWWCGSRTSLFRLLDEPDSPICQMCILKARTASEWGEK